MTLTKSKLIDLYLNKHLGITEISKTFDISYNKVRKQLILIGIKPRNRKEAIQNAYKYNVHNVKGKISESLKINNPMFKEENREKQKEKLIEHHKEHPETGKKISKAIKKWYKDNPEVKYTKARYGKEHHHWKGGLLKLICEKCGKVRHKERGGKPYINNLCRNCFKHTQPQSSIEVSMSNGLKSLNIEFVEQFKLGRYFYDFCIPEIMLLIETDGKYWHSIPENKARDLLKNKLAIKNGYTLFRFSEDEVKDNINKCIKQIEVWNSLGV